MGLDDTGRRRPSRRTELAAYFAERARGGAAAVVTGGYSPNQLGVLSPFAHPFNDDMVHAHKQVTAAVHEHDSLAFRSYCTQDATPSTWNRSALAPPKHRSARFLRALSGREVAQTVQDFAHSAKLAAEAGYDGCRSWARKATDQPIPFLTHQPARRRGQQHQPVLEISPGLCVRMPHDFSVDFRMSMLELVEEAKPKTRNLELATVWPESTCSAPVSAGMKPRYSTRSPCRAQHLAGPPRV